MKSWHVFGIVGVALLALGLWNCGSGSSDGGCTQDSDCSKGVGFRCLNQVCVSTACTKDTECLSGEYCKTGDADSEGDCTALPSCTADDTCPSGTRCKYGTCASKACKAADDCLPTESCNYSSGLCEVTTADGDGESALCEEKATRCRSNTLEICSYSGTDSLGWRYSADCADGCATNDAGIAACVVPEDGDSESEAAICTAAAMRCNEATGAVETCASDGSAWDVTDPCSQGTCKYTASTGKATCGPKVVCTANEMKCSDDATSLIICNSAGTEQTSTLCGTNMVCKVVNSVAQCASSAGCTLNRYRCNNNNVEKCQSTGWTNYQSCGSSATCTCSSTVSGECTLASCQANTVCSAFNDKRCNGNVIEWCNATGTGWSTMPNGDCAANSQVCQNGACVSARR